MSFTASPRHERYITQHAEHWRIECMPLVECNVLRLAAYEMTHSDTPAAVAIDEALELARRYSIGAGKGWWGTGLNPRGCGSPASA
jgi:transcription termination factor NusB